jgi:hypothetical protein
MANPQFLRFLFILLLMAGVSMARGVTYVVLWFDTEDYIDPIADDAALRIANDLTSLGVRATFKVVGEKARVLERRGRLDVIQALGRHCIGYLRLAQHSTDARSESATARIA